MLPKRSSIRLSKYIIKILITLMYCIYRYIRIYIIAIILGHAVLALLFVLNANADQFGNDYPVRYLSGVS